MGLFDHSNSNREIEINDILMGLFFEDLFNKVLRLKKCHNYNISDRAIKIEQEYVKYLLVILSGSVLVLLKNSLLLKPMNDEEFHEMVLKSVYKNCSFIEGLVEKQIIGYPFCSYGLRLDVLSRFNRYKYEISKSIKTKKSYCSAYLIDLFEIKTVEKINSSSGDIQTEIRPLSDEDIFSSKKYNFILSDIKEFQDQLLRFFDVF